MKQETQKKQLPMQIYVDEAAIKDDQRNIESLVEAVADLSSDLEREDILLDDKLLEGIVQEGTHAIFKKALEFAGESKAVSMMAGNLTAAANRISIAFETHVRKLHSSFMKSGYNQEIIRLINGKPSLKEDVLDEIRKRNEFTIKTPEDLELYERLSNFVNGFNDLREWIRKNRPEMVDLVDQAEAALTQHFFDGNKIDSFSDYLINKPNEARDDISLMVNPLYFGS